MVRLRLQERLKPLILTSRKKWRCALVEAPPFSDRMEVKREARWIVFGGE